MRLKRIPNEIVQCHTLKYVLKGAKRAQRGFALQTFSVPLINNFRIYVCMYVLRMCVVYVCMNVFALRDVVHLNLEL